MSVDNVDNMESNDNALDSGDDIVENTLDSVDGCNLYDNVAGQENIANVCNNCLDYDFDENLEDHPNLSDKENIQKYVGNIPKVSLELKK